MKAKRLAAAYFWMPKEKPGASLADSVEWFWQEGEYSAEHGPFATKPEAKRDRAKYLAKGTGNGANNG